jgi:hypothetical protein
VYASPDRFDIHYQFTDTPAGSYWSATHLTPDAPARALTTGVRYSDARWFRGRRTPHQEVRCPDEAAVGPGGPMPQHPGGTTLQAHLVTVLSGRHAAPARPRRTGEFVERHPPKTGLPNQADGVP